MSYHLNTKRGYPFPAVSSAMQKAIRRGDAKLAGHWALELWASGFGHYVWRRLLTVSAEDSEANESALRCAVRPALRGPPAGGRRVEDIR